MRKLILVRGATGSGKTTIAKKLMARYEGAEHYEADTYFVGEDGVYRFDPLKLTEAHAYCMDKTKTAMRNDVSVVIVSNTSTTAWEMNPYIKLAEDYHYEVEIFRTPDPWDPKVLAARNVHGVPEFVIRKQINRYQPFAGEMIYGIGRKEKPVLDM